MRRMMWMAVIAIGACAEGVDERRAGYELEVRGGNLHAEVIGTRAIDEVIATAALAPVVGPLGTADFAAQTFVARSPAGRELSYVHAEQVVDGVPIAGAYLHVMMAPEGDGGRLVGSSYHLFHGVEVDTHPAIDGVEAERRAREALRVDGEAVRTRRLAIHELDGELALVWEIGMEDHPRRALVRANGELVGRVAPLDDRAYETTGTVRAWIAEGAPGGGGEAMLVPLGSARVWAGETATLTTSTGAYTLDAAAGSTVSAALVGTAASVINRSGTAAIASAAASPRVDLSIGSATAGEQVLAQTTAFHAVNAARRFLIDNGIEAGALGGPVTTRVNLPDVCNAYYAPGARSLNFFRSGGGCHNSAEESIVLHEYGHFVDDVFGGIDDGGLSEGWGDTLACFARRDPVVGGDLFRDGGILRTCDNDYRYPPSGRDEVHDLGQAWAGFAWHVREGLIARLGEARGDALARALILPSLVSGAPDIPAAVREVFLRDDDDGDVGNGTPHFAILRAAAARHGLERLIDADEAPPAAVEDLAIVAAAATRITVRWSAPGDDGRRGTAARYDLRWAAAPITASSFAAATAVVAPAPAPAGTMQETTIDVPPLTRVYVALRASDELGNVSTLSNVASAELPGAHTVFHDGAEDGLGAWEATGLWHVTRRHAGAGRQAFWFGREDGGTFNTGMRSAGTLTSPPVALAGVDVPRLAWLERVDVERDDVVDVLDVEVFDAADPARRVVVHKTTGHTRGFVLRVLDLAPLAGRTVRIRFTFDSVDGRLNGTLGWFVDEVRVLSAAAPPATAGVLVINEVLADPPAGHDTNGDGVWDARTDEMLELVNGGDAPLDLGGATIADAASVRATLPAGTVLAPGRALVLFGGRAPTLTGVLTIPTTGLSLNNDGDTLVVHAPGGAVLAETRYGAEAAHDQSLTRRTDADRAAPLVGHRTLSNLPASPGRRHDGRPFDGTP